MRRFTADELADHVADVTLSAVRQERRRPGGKP
jgi:hypothetical protein